MDKLREEIEQIIYDDDGKEPAKGTVDAIIALIENEKAKQRGEVFKNCGCAKCRSWLTFEELNKELTQTGEKESK